MGWFISFFFFKELQNYRTLSSDDDSLFTPKKMREPSWIHLLAEDNWAEVSSLIFNIIFSNYVDSSFIMQMLCCFLLLNRRNTVMLQKYKFHHLLHLLVMVIIKEDKHCYKKTKQNKTVALLNMLLIRQHDCHWDTKLNTSFSGFMLLPHGYTLHAPTESGVASTVRGHSDLQLLPPPTTLGLTQKLLWNWTLEYSATVWRFKW